MQFLKSISILQKRRIRSNFGITAQLIKAIFYA